MSVRTAPEPRRHFDAFFVQGGYDRRWLRLENATFRSLGKRCREARTTWFGLVVGCSDIYGGHKSISCDFR